MTKPAKAWYRYIAMGLITFVLAGAVATTSAVLILDRLGVDVYWELWSLRESVFGPESVGIWQADDRYGWTHIPLATGRQRMIPDYDVQYHIDKSGHRVTPNSPASGTPTVLFLGGSFAFGHGVEDSEPYPALIQRAWPEYRVANAAVNAWGTTQALLSLEDELARNEQIVLVVYGFITHHHQRNFVRESWLESLMATRKRRNPYFEVDGDRIVFQGLADPVLDGQPDSAELARRELLMTGLLLRDMASLCAERNIPFTVVYLPDGSRDIGISLLNSAVGADAVVDLRPWFDYEDLHFRHDIHLHPQGHRKVAEILRPLLEARLPRSGRSKNYLRNSSDTNHATSALRGSGVQSSNSSTD